MFGQVRNNSFEDIFNFQREVDQFLRGMSVRPSQAAPPYPFQIHTTQDSWRIEIPMPGVDPARVTLEVAGNAIAVRLEHDGGRDDGATQWEQTITVPRILDLDGMRATHRHGMLVLTIPLKESVKPRRVQIDGVGADTKTQKQLTTA